MLKDRWADPKGRLWYVKGMVGSHSCTLATIHAPNATGAVCGGGSGAAQRIHGGGH